MQTLSKMLSVHTKKNEVCTFTTGYSLFFIMFSPHLFLSKKAFVSCKEMGGSDELVQVSYDIVEDILEQGDSMRDTLQQMQDAVHLTKVLYLLPLSI